MTPRLYIGNALWRAEEAAHAQAMRRLYAHLITNRIDFCDRPQIGDALIERARSKVFSDFLRSDYDVCVTIDSDIYFRPEDVVRIAKLAEVYSLIGAVYMKRSQEQCSPSSQLALNDGPVLFSDDAIPMRINFLSSGFMAVHRRVIEALVDHPTVRLVHATTSPYWTFCQPFNFDAGHDWLELSEDWAFCQRAREVGFETYIDPSIRLGHYGVYEYTMEDALRDARPEPRPIMWRMNSDGMVEIAVPESKGGLRPQQTVQTTPDRPAAAGLQNPGTPTTQPPIVVQSRGRGSRATSRQ